MGRRTLPVTHPAPAAAPRSSGGAVATFLERLFELVPATDIHASCFMKDLSSSALQRAFAFLGFDLVLDIPLLYLAVNVFISSEKSYQLLVEPAPTVCHVGYLFILLLYSMTIVAYQRKLPGEMILPETG